MNNTTETAMARDEHIAEIKRMLPKWEKEEILLNPSFERLGLHHKVDAIEWLLQELLRLEAENQLLQKKVEKAREALSVAIRESDRHDVGDEFTGTNDLFRNIRLCAERALSELTPST